MRGSQPGTITVCSSAFRGSEYDYADLIAEIANNGYRDGFSALNNTEESFRTDGPSISVDQRKMNAVRAYFEWMPIRLVAPPQVFRNVAMTNKEQTSRPRR